MARKPPTKIQLIAAGLAPDELRWRKWIIDRMTNKQRKLFARAGHPVDPRPYADQGVVDEAKLLAELNHFNVTLETADVPDASAPTWLEGLFERMLLWIRGRLRR